MPAGTCDAGYLQDPTNGCQPCPMDEYSPAGNEEAVCTKCPEGTGRVAIGEGTQDSDCIPSKTLFVDYSRFSVISLNYSPAYV